MAFVMLVPTLITERFNTAVESPPGVGIVAVKVPGARQVIPFQV
jgi:hypothetical protein